MAVRANPRLIEDIERFGAEDVSKCYHCGNCSAACPFSEEPFIFPRRTMRYLQMGAESLALLLLRRVQRSMPARRRTGRNHDEPAPVAFRPVRYHRHRPMDVPLLGEPTAG